LLLGGKGRHRLRRRRAATMSCRKDRAPRRCLDCSRREAAPASWRQGKTSSLAAPSRDNVTVLVYKILRPAEWAGFEAAGRFDGSPDDHASGFVHFSSRAQVGATAQRFFADEPELVLLAVDADALGDRLRWEPSPHSGDPFPHLYDIL